VERLLGLVEQRLSLVPATLAEQPLGVLELRDREVEGHPEFAEERLGSQERSFGYIVLSFARVQKGTEPVAVPAQEGRHLTGLESLEAGEQVP
jgi:hypothetical protein